MLNAHSRTYRSTKVILGKVGRLAPEKVTMHYYSRTVNVRACFSLLEADIKCLDFAINHMIPNKAVLGQRYKRM